MAIARAGMAGSLALILSGGAVHAQSVVPANPTTPAAPAAAASQPAADQPAGGAPTAGFLSGIALPYGIKLGAQVNAGITVNPTDPRNGINFGHLFTDKANRPLLNQILLTASKDIDTAVVDWQWGFKTQLLYGSDARIVHTLGVFDRMIHDRNQLAVVEANVAVRVPVLAGGLDLKLGLFPTPLGFELIDPKTNPFYSRSYIFNYGLPFKHVGGLAVAHVSPLLDLYGGVTSGTNTSFGSGGDNNDRPAGLFGFGLNLLGGKVTVLALSHVGPENPTRSTPFGNTSMRYFNDVVVSWKATDELTLTAEGNYVRDDGFRAEAWGIAGYAAYKLNDQLTLNARAEVFRDNNNFFVSVPVSNRDYVNVQRGDFSRLYTASRPTTYSEFTLGVTWKPQGTPQALSNLLIRPELRYDRALNNSRPYGDGRDRGQFTIGADIVVGF